MIQRPRPKPPGGSRHPFAFAASAIVIGAGLLGAYYVGFVLPNDRRIAFPFPSPREEAPPRLLVYDFLARAPEARFKRTEPSGRPAPWAPEDGYFEAARVFLAGGAGAGLRTEPGG